MPARRRQQGQAMVEFLVATMFVLVPLYLIIAALGKFADVQAGAQQAARYAAWERTIWSADSGWRARMGTTNAKSTLEIRSEIAQRTLGENRLTIAATDRSRNALMNGTMRMWTDGSGQALLERYEDVGLAESNSRLGATECATCAFDTALPFPAPFNLGINVPQNNMVVAAVSLDVARNSAPLKRLFPAYTGWNGLQLSDRVALLPNEWMANGRDAVKAVVKDAVPTANDPIKTVLSASVKAPMALFTKEIRDLKIGDIRPDEVPRDRLR